MRMYYLSITFTVITRQIETIWTIKTIPQKISLVELVPGSRYGCDPWKLDLLMLT